MHRRFEGKVAIVTGSSKGIGRACARRLGSEGARVVINGRDADDLQTAAKELASAGVAVHPVAGDLADVATPDRLVAEAVAAFGRIDLVVSSIGLAPYIGPPLGIDHASFAQTMVGNTWLVMGLLKVALEAGLGAGGAVVTVSAIGTRKLFPPAATYSASKAALDTLTRELALELAPRGIRVNAVAPGLTRTPATSFLLDAPGMEEKQARAVPLGRIGRPEDIAAAVAFLLSEDASYITGVVLDVDGGALLSPVAFEG